MESLLHGDFNKYIIEDSIFKDFNVKKNSLYTISDSKNSIFTISNFQLFNLRFIRYIIIKKIRKFFNDY